MARVEVAIRIWYNLVKNYRPFNREICSDMKAKIGIMPTSFLFYCLSLVGVESFALADTFLITFRNKTPQTLTSSVCAIHSDENPLFSTGSAASSGLAQLAQDGVTDIFRGEVSAVDGVQAVKVGASTSKKSRSKVRISAKQGSLLSCVNGMLVATNDGFVAFQNVKLPKKIGKSKRIKARAYDAGSEVNTESCTHVPGGPCNAHFVGEDENGTVQPHPGILGIADLVTATHGWSEPALIGRVRRIK